MDIHILNNNCNNLTDVSEDIKQVTCFQCLKEYFPKYNFSYGFINEDIKVIQIRNKKAKIAEAKVTITKKPFPLFIFDVWVHYRHRRKGLARIMMRKIMLEEGPPILLRAYQFGKNSKCGNKDLIKFYESLGFVELNTDNKMLWKI